MLHQPEGKLEDSLRAAVVLFQQVLGATREMLLEVLHVREVCPPEAVDGLVIVPDNAQVVPGQLLDQLELGIVGVLELVDQDVGEPFAVPAEDGGRLSKSRTASWIISSKSSRFSARLYFS